MPTTSLTTSLVTAGRPCVREIDHRDRAHVIDLFYGLSQEDRYRRFLSPMPVYPAALIDMLTAIDGERHIAVAAFQHERCVGIARAIRHAGRSETADVAVTVAADQRRRGIGRCLVLELAGVVAERGVVSLGIMTLGDNRPAAALARSAGFRLRFDDGLLVGEAVVADLVSMREARAA